MVLITWFGFECETLRDGVLYIISSLVRMSVVNGMEESISSLT